MLSFVSQSSYARSGTEYDDEIEKDYVLEEETMNQLIHYLSMIPQTKELVVLIGENADCRFIEAACKMICLERMVIFTNSHEVKKKVIHIIDSLPTDAENHVPECIEFCDSNEYDHYRPMFNPTAFCFDAVKSNADIVRFSTMNPQYVFGIVHKDYTNAFVIWESFRHNAEKFILSLTMRMMKH